MDLHAEHSSSKMKVTGGLATALATPSLLLLATPASGQTTEPAQLTPIQVEGTRPAPFNVKHSASDKFTAPVLDTTKSLQIVPQELIQSQAASTLTDVLRNSPGITFGAGEGGNPLGIARLSAVTMRSPAHLSMACATLAPPRGKCSTWNRWK